MTIRMEDLEAGRVDFGDVQDPEGRTLPPVHPGEILADWMEEFGLSAYALAKALAVPRNRIGGIVQGKRPITPDTALRLARHFGTSPGFWLGLQADHDLEEARARLGATIAEEVMPGPYASAA